MFYPIITGLQIEEARQRDSLAPGEEQRQPIMSHSNVPTRWDTLRLNLGDWLIEAGQRVRSGSAYAGCDESKALQVTPSGGKA
jgi:hypothetical protein